MNQSIKNAITIACTTLVLALGFPTGSRAGVTVAPDWDLFATQPGTMFMSQAFGGVNLGTFDFGGTIGIQPTGTADIVRRQDTANAPIDTIPIEMVALQLRSVNPTGSFNALQSIRGGPASTGTMTVTFGPEPLSLMDPHGTFDSIINVFFDVRIGALNGPIILSDVLPLISDDVPWAHQSPDPNVLEISGVNTLLNGIDRTADFFPIGTFREEHPAPAIHVVRTAQVPEPATLAIVGAGLAVLALRRRRGARRLTEPAAL